MSNIPLNQRILKETQKLATDPIEGISAEPEKDSPRYFRVTIAGPQESPYEAGVFKLQLYLPEEYPRVPPKVMFLTKVYHPSVTFLGRIGLDILKDNWSPALQIRNVLLAIQYLLCEPNSGDPINEFVNKHWLEDKDDAIQVARDWTLKYASQ